MLAATLLQNLAIGFGGVSIVFVLAFVSYWLLQELRSRTSPLRQNCDLHAPLAESTDAAPRE